MSRFPLVLVLSLVALAVALPAPAAAGASSLVVTVDGEAYAFRVGGLTGENPAIELEAGSTVTVTFRNNGSTVHNLAFGAPVSTGSQILAPGANETFTFTVPASAAGATTYYCEPHQFQGMEGAVSFKAAAPDPTPTTRDPTQESRDGNGIPGPGLLVVLLGALGAAALVRAPRRA